MAHCKILYPGLLGPDVPLEELARSEWPDQQQLPCLSLLFARAQARAQLQVPFEHQLLSNLGYVISPQAELPVAALRLQSDDDDKTPLWCLDPVYLQVDREMAYLAATDELDLSEQEARQLIRSINQHFGEELHILYHKPQQWLLRQRLHLRTHTPAEAMMHDIERMQVHGEDARRWASVLNEIQMLLHAHPVNATRLDKQQRPVNSLWLWGGGDVHVTDPEVDVVYSNHALAADAALRNAIAHEPLPDRIEASTLENRNVLLVITEQQRAIQQKDVYAWLALLKQLEQQVLAPLFGMFTQGNLQKLTLCSDSLCLDINQKDLRKWWRRRSRLDSKILHWRNSYAG